MKRAAFVHCTFMLAAVAFLSAGCRAHHPGVIIVSIDSLRYDDTLAVVQGHPVTPRLADFAHGAVVFDRAVSGAPWTTPSISGLMTGMLPPAHGVEEHDRAIASSVPLLAERFKAAGYRTAAFVPATTLRPEYGFGRGFDVYDYENYGHATLSSPLMIGKALHWLEGQKDERFFLWIHLWDPHYNYIPPPPYDSEFREGRRPAREDVQCLKWVENAVAPDEAVYFHGQYRGEVAYTDRYVGDVLDFLEGRKLAGAVVVAVLADHGDSFQEHGWLGHTNRVDETLIHVPLMLRWPGHLAPARVGERVSTVSLGRTLLDLAGLDVNGFGLEPGLPLPGRTVPGARTAEARILSETIRQGCFTSLSGPRYKYVLEHRTCAESLFDVEADPGERHDLARERAETVAAYRKDLRGELARLRAANVPKAALPPEIVREAENALRSLGYVSSGGKSKGSQDITCIKGIEPTKVDALGDMLSEPCPQEGAQRCLDRPEPKPAPR